MGFGKFHALVVVMALCGLVGAEDAPKTRKDPQSAYEPRSGPGIGQKFLEKMVGDWEVVKTFHPRAGDPVRMNGECHQSMIHQGRFLQSEFSFDLNGTRTTGL